MSKEKQSKNKVFSYLFSVGVFGALFSSILAYVAHLFKFIPFGPGILLQLLPGYDTTGWMRGPMGHLIAILLIGLLGFLGAYIYYILLKRMYSIWIGLWYGLAIWMLIFLGLNRVIPGVKTIGELGWNSNITLICIFIFYGVIVGYSISYEYSQGTFDTKKEGDEKEGEEKEEEEKKTDSKDKDSKDKDSKEKDSKDK